MKINDGWKKKLTGDNSLKLDSWEQFMDFINTHQKEISGCLFRGQRNPKWELKPSFFRQSSESDGIKLQHQAYHHLDNFKKFTRGRHKISYTDPNDDEDNWWALGQHYGLATPLLDWVKTPYVAAFFAFIEEAEEKSTSTRIIYILDIEKIRNLYDGSIPNIEIIEPLTHENNRLVSQQGIFTFIRDFKYYSIENYLNDFRKICKSEISDEILLLKLTISSKERERILEKLNLMNINKSTLFPDLSGSSEYCNYLLMIENKSN